MAARDAMFSVCPSIRPLVRYQYREHDILKMNEPILMQIGTSRLLDKGMKQRSTFGVSRSRLRWHEAEDRFGGQE